MKFFNESDRPHPLTLSPKQRAEQDAKEKSKPAALAHRDKFFLQLKNFLAIPTVMLSLTKDASPTKPLPFHDLDLTANEGDGDRSHHGSGEATPEPKHGENRNNLTPETQGEMPSQPGTYVLIKNGVDQVSVYTIPDNDPASKSRVMTTLNPDNPYLPVTHSRYSSGEWIEVQLENGNTGWVENNGDIVLFTVKEQDADDDSEQQVTPTPEDDDPETLPIPGKIVLPADAHREFFVPLPQEHTKFALSFSIDMQQLDSDREFYFEFGNLRYIFYKDSQGKMNITRYGRDDDSAPWHSYSWKDLPNQVGNHTTVEIISSGTTIEVKIDGVSLGIDYYSDTAEIRLGLTEGDNASSLSLGNVSLTDLP